MLRRIIVKCQFYVNDITGRSRVSMLGWAASVEIWKTAPKNVYLTYNIKIWSLKILFARIYFCTYMNTILKWNHFITLLSMLCWKVLYYCLYVYEHKEFQMCEAGPNWLKKDFDSREDFDFYSFWFAIQFDFIHFDSVWFWFVANHDSLANHGSPANPK